MTSCSAPRAGDPAPPTTSWSLDAASISGRGYPGWADWSSSDDFCAPTQMRAPPTRRCCDRRSFSAPLRGVMHDSTMSMRYCFPVATGRGGCAPTSTARFCRRWSPTHSDGGCPSRRSATAYARGPNHRSSDGPLGAARSQDHRAHLGSGTTRVAADSRHPILGPRLLPHVRRTSRRSRGIHVGAGGSHSGACESGRLLRRRKGLAEPAPADVGYRARYRRRFATGVRRRR